MEIIKQPKWKIVEYSKNQIIKAGKTIKKENISDEERKSSIAVIDNWRASHAFPLHIIYMHLRRLAKTNHDIIVSERLKRLDSILGKLKREPTMSLWTMQDLGGCRFVVPTVEDVYAYAEKFEKSRKRHVLVNKYDYIRNPKPSGYRSVHMVYQYKSDRTETYNKNMLIEIQFRTHLQHIWATAVETMGLFTKEAIKSGQGSSDVKRFFALISSLFAILENQNIVPNTSADIDDLVDEIKSLDEKNKYLAFLSGIKVAVSVQNHKKSEYSSHNSYYFLKLDYNKRRLSIDQYKASEFEKANDAYNDIEQKKPEANIDAVLVRSNSFDTLRSAYPNYFSDITEFLSIVYSYLEGEKK